jgi:putative glutamine amidotransferase
LLIGTSARIYYPGTPGIQVKGVWTKTLHYLEQSVAHWVMRGGAMAVMVPGVDSSSTVIREDLNLDHYAAALDGLVLQGGNDVSPLNYGEQPLKPEWAGDPVRDRYERELIDAFIRAGKPVLGVCRGFQLLNVHFGGTLYQDITTQRPQAREHRDGARYERHLHEIELVAGTRLAHLYPGTQRAVANSIHHQGIKALAPGLVVEATSTDDGIIEAFRWQGPSYVAGVQWHPEFHDPSDTTTFDDGPMLQDFFAASRTVRD